MARSAARPDTRAEIITVAMRLFVENGYDKTSLREIAEAIGVTKAALYYHFPSKEDIVRTAMDEHAGRVQQMLDGLAEVAPGPERHRTAVDLVVNAFTPESQLVVRFGQANPTAVTNFEFGKKHVDQIQDLIALLGPSDDPASSIRATLAFGAIMLTLFDPAHPERERSPDRLAIGRQIALELLEPLGVPDA